MEYQKKDESLIMPKNELDFDILNYMKSKIFQEILEEKFIYFNEFLESQHFNYGRPKPTPIERIFFCMFNQFNPFEDDRDISHSELTPQFPIIINRNEYYIDFLLGILCFGKQFKVAIELDGHDFHEKTKDQAQRDKQRDRDLQLKGFCVLHFTGSEVCNNIDEVLGEIYMFVSDRFISKVKAERN